MSYGGMLENKIYSLTSICKQTWCRSTNGIIELPSPHKLTARWTDGMKQNYLCGTSISSTRGQYPAACECNIDKMQTIAMTAAHEQYLKRKHIQHLSQL
jgi:hypothetical protein